MSRKQNNFNKTDQRWSPRENCFLDKVFICNSYLVDKFIHGASPLDEDFVETTEAAGIGHIPGVGDCHLIRLCLPSLLYAKLFVKSARFNWCAEFCFCCVAVVYCCTLPLQWECLWSSLKQCWITSTASIMIHEASRFVTREANFVTENTKKISIICHQTLFVRNEDWGSKIKKPNNIIALIVIGIVCSLEQLWR